MSKEAPPPAPNPEWPPAAPKGPKPKFDDPGAADWRYQRYLNKQGKAGRRPEDTLSFADWKARHFDPAAKGGRPGRSGGKAQVGTRKALQEEGFRNVENVELGGRYPDMVRPNAKGGTDYAEVGHMLKKGKPEARERVTLADEIRALKENDTITFIDKNNPSRRTTYRPGDSVD